MPRNFRAAVYPPGGLDERQQPGSPDDAVRTSAGSALPPHPPGRGPARSGALVVTTLLVLLVVVLGAVLAVVLLRWPQVQPEPVSPTIADPVFQHQIELPIPSDLTGTATLSSPTVASVKVAPQTPSQWCSVLTAADVRAVTGFDQQGPPDSTSVCTHHLAEGAGYLFVSDIPAPGGAPYAVYGNSAIVYQTDPTACEVSVALDHRGGVLDIDIRGVTSHRVPICEAAVALAVRALDRLPAA